MQQIDLSRYEECHFQLPDESNKAVTSGSDPAIAQSADKTLRYPDVGSTKLVVLDFCRSCNTFPVLRPFAHPSELFIPIHAFPFLPPFLLFFLLHLYVSFSLFFTFIVFLSLFSSSFLSFRLFFNLSSVVSFFLSITFFSFSFFLSLLFQDYGPLWANGRNCRHSHHAPQRSGSAGKTFFLFFVFFFFCIFQS